MMADTDKWDGIDLSGIVQKADSSEFTEAEHNEFMDSFIEWIEAHGLTFGGGTHLIITSEEQA